MQRQVVQGHDRQPHPHPEEHDARQHLGQVAAVDGHPAQQQQTGRRDERSHHHLQARPEPVEQPDRRGHRGHQGRRERQRAQAGGQRREAENDLEVQREVDHRPHPHRTEQGLDGERSAPGAVDDHTERQQGLRRTPLDEHERDEQDGAQAEEPHSRRCRPRVLGEREPVHHAGEATCRGERPRHVVAPAAAGAALREQHSTRDEPHDDQRHVDQEAPTPREQLGEQAAEHHAQGRADARQGAEDRERAAALTPVREAQRHEGERSRGHESGGEPLDPARGEQRAGLLSEPAPRGARPEDREPEEVRTSTAPVVGDPTAEQQEGSERQRVGGDDPLPGRVRDRQVRLRAGQCDVDDRAVEHDEELGERDGGERPPTVGRRGNACHGRAFRCTCAGVSSPRSARTSRTSAGGAGHDRGCGRAVAGRPAPGRPAAGVQPARPVRIFCSRSR